MSATACGIHTRFAASPHPNTLQRASGSEPQWKCHAPSGVELTDEQKAKLSKAEKTVAEKMAAGAVLVSAWTPLLRETMEVKDKVEGQRPELMSPERMS